MHFEVIAETNGIRSCHCIASLQDLVFVEKHNAKPNSKLRSIRFA